MRRTITVLCVLLAAICLPASVRAEQGVTDKEIVIGMSTVLTGPASFLGTNFRLGAEAHIRKVNDAGGVHGRKLRLVVYDDGYEPQNTAANVEKLLKSDKVFCLLGNVGTPTTVAIKDTLEKEKVPLFFPFTGAEVLRSPVSRYLFHYRASYNQETEAFIQGMVDELGLKRIAVFYQDDAYGQAVLAGTLQALKTRSLKPVALGTYTRNLEDIQEALDAIMKERPDAVVMAGTYSAVAKFIIAWKRQSIIEGKNDRDPVFMNVSFVGPESLSDLLGKYGDNVVVTQVVPSYYTYFGGVNYPAVSEYLLAVNKYSSAAKPTFGSLEGYLATKVLVEVLKGAGTELTRESALAAAERIKNLDISAGNSISFSPENHQGSQTVYPTVLKNGRYYLIKDWKAVKQ
ncbi:MAG TPA: hypothetical protein DCS42_15755 [Nitrospiraceae bacterium]|jgi:branched-chain amino acid transport system substrate-binding protein|nr:hypothetical protein [Nitrospiraceae bacterium]